MTNPSTLYPFSELPQSQVPPRSALKHLAPLGVGTIASESLTSYSSRLAEAHHLHPKDLLEGVIASKLNRTYLLGGETTKSSNFWSRTLEAINTTGEWATDWVQVLESLTLYKNLAVLTWLPWKNTLSANALPNKNKQWCPQCFAEWKKLGLPLYEPLLWATKIVEVCPTHQQVLQNRCPHCQSAQHLLAPRSFIGYCMRCKKSLETPPLESQATISDKQLWVAQAVGELIAQNPRLTSPVPSLSQTLQRKQGDEEPKLFARKYKIPLRRLNVWLTEATLTRELKTILQVANQLQLTPAQLLVPELVSEVTQLENLKPYQFAGQKVFKSQELKEHLERILEKRESPPPTLKFIAQQLGCDLKVLTRRCPREAELIKQRYLDYHKNQHEKRIALTKAQIDLAVKELVTNHLYPSKRKVSHLLSKPAMLRNRELYDYWRSQALKWKKLKVKAVS